MLDGAFGEDRRHECVGVVDALTALKAQREGERVGDVFGRGVRQSVAIVRHPSRKRDECLDD